MPSEHGRCARERVVTNRGESAAEQSRRRRGGARRPARVPSRPRSSRGTARARPGCCPAAAATRGGAPCCSRSPRGRCSRRSSSSRSTCCASATTVPAAGSRPGSSRAWPSCCATSRAGRPTRARVVTIRPPVLMGVGLTVAVLTALAPVLFGAPVLSSAKLAVPLPLLGRAGDRHQPVPRRRGVPADRRRGAGPAARARVGHRARHARRGGADMTPGDLVAAPTVNLVMALTVGVLYSVGFYLMLQRSLMRVLIGVVVLGHGTNLLLQLVGGPPARRADRRQLPARDVRRPAAAGARAHRRRDHLRADHVPAGAGLPLVHAGRPRRGAGRRRGPPHRAHPAPGRVARDRRRRRPRRRPGRRRTTADDDRATARGAR